MLTPETNGTKTERKFDKNGDGYILLRSFISKETILFCDETAEIRAEDCNSTKYKITHSLYKQG
jgi:hypothetical protein